MRKKIILSLFLVLIGISLLCITACSNINTEKQYQDFAEAAAQQIISNTLKSPSSAIWNETSYIEDNGQGMYVVYVDVEATNSFDAYIRSKFFVIVKDINLEEKKFSYSKLFPYYECSGKNDTYSLDVLKKLNNYDGQSENTEGSDNSNNNPEDPTNPEGGNNDNKPESSADKVTVSFISDGNIVSINEIEKNTPIDSAPTVEKKNYKFIGWFLEKQEISFPYTAVNSVTFVAKWEGIDCRYRTNNDGSVQEYTVKYGEKVNILPVTKDGYIFKGWYYGDEQITNEQGVCLEPWHYSEQIELTPKMDLITYDICYEVNSYGGKIVHEGISNRFFSFEVSVQDDYCAPIITAEPDNGYRFVQWSDGSTDPQRQDTNIHEDITITAEFVRVYNLTFTVGGGGTIQGETVQSVPVGGSGTAVTAVPNEGYTFVRWSDGVTTATRTDTDINSDINVTAEFDIIANTVDFAGGNGTVEHPYQIANSEHLRNVELYPSAHFVLTADIVLPEVSAGNNNFTPLFSDEKPFLGTLDGAGHKITNLTVYNTETFYSGLFSVIGSTGSVKNLTLENASVSGTNYVGIIAGWSLGSITDCTVSGVITRIAANGYKVFVGGVAGRAEENVNGCSAAVNLTVTEAQVEIYVGGIVGYLSSSGSSSSPLTLTALGTISVSGAHEVYVGGLVGRASSSAYLSKCHTEMQITAISSYSAYAGGLIGCGYGYVTYVTITDSYATGNVTASSDPYNTYAGGLIGYNNNSITTITDSYATGDVTASGSYDAYAGGLIGYGDSTTITDSYATGNVTASGSYDAYAGGLIGYGYTGGSITITDSYATGNVTASGSYDAYAGGLIGYGYGTTVRNAYSSSAVFAESGNTAGYVGGLVGYVSDSVNLENAHWLKSADTDAVYAVGYSDSLGVPTSIGSTSHAVLDEFYALADTLNAGREVPVWEHTGENTLPSLIIGGDESAE